MSEAIDRFRKVSADFDARVHAVPADKWAAPSPCEGWTARDVVVHVTNNHRRLAGGVLPPVQDDDDVVAAWEATRLAMAEFLSTADLAATHESSSFGAMPRADFIGRIMATDTLVHTWDLARAAGIDEVLDADAVAGAYSGLKPLDEMIRRPGFFAGKIDAPASADLQAEFLSFLGRQV